MMFLSIQSLSSDIYFRIPFEGKREPKQEESVSDTKVMRSAQIGFEKIILSKKDEASRDLRGSVALTCDEKHTGFLHILIYVGQLINALFTGKDWRNVNLCHGEIILGVNHAKGKENQLILAHGVFDGIKTTSEDHKTDEIITAVHIYRPIDERMRMLFATFAEQTAVNFKKEGINPKSADFKAALRDKVGQFSFSGLLMSFFHRQETKASRDQQERVAFAAADLLKGDKLRDEKGNLASFYCTSYMLTLMQGTSLVSALSAKELQSLSVLSREEIAKGLVQRIQNPKKDDFLAATYWENEFMQANADCTMSYFAGDLLDRASFHEIKKG